MPSLRKNTQRFLRFLWLFWSYLPVGLNKRRGVRSFVSRFWSTPAGKITSLVNLVKRLGSWKLGSNLFNRSDQESIVMFTAPALSQNLISSGWDHIRWDQAEFRAGKTVLAMYKEKRVVRHQLRKPLFVFHLARYSIIVRPVYVFPWWRYEVYMQQRHFSRHT